MTLTWFTAIVLTLASLRVTLIITRDTIMEPVRTRVLTKNAWLGELFHCPDCMGVWVATGTIIAYALVGTTTLWVAAPLAASMVGSIIVRLIDY